MSKVSINVDSGYICLQFDSIEVENWQDCLRFESCANATHYIRFLDNEIK